MQLFLIPPKIRSPPISVYYYIKENIESFYMKIPVAIDNHPLSGMQPRLLSKRRQNKKRFDQSPLLQQFRYLCRSPPFSPLVPILLFLCDVGFLNFHTQHPCIPFPIPRTSTIMIIIINDREIQKNPIHSVINGLEDFIHVDYLCFWCSTVCRINIYSC